MISEQQALRICKMLFPHGDNHYAKKQESVWVLSFTNDYELQHGNGYSVHVPEIVLGLIFTDIPSMFNEKIGDKIREVRENGDGEVPNSTYWNCVGLFDSKHILEKILTP